MRRSLGVRMANKLYFGDNLWVLRDIPSESVDLIYLDPPFNSAAQYNVLFRTPSGDPFASQAGAFQDTWHWTEESEFAFDRMMTRGGAAAEMLSALRNALGSSDMMAYLANMSVRLYELHRVLRPTGSLFLHCDTNAVHYLRVLLDSVFGANSFRNEIIWRRTGANKSTKRFGPIHQNILFYGKSKDSFFAPVYGPYTQDYADSYFRYEDENGRYRPVLLTGPGKRHGDSGKPWRGINPSNSGRHWQPASYLYDKYHELTGEELGKYTLHERLDRLDDLGLIHWGKRKGTQPNYKYYLEDAKGVAYQDIWAYQPGTKGCVMGSEDGIDADVKWLMSNAKERIGYPTQKPLGLLRRIINAASRPGDVVLDPFCGCGTTVHAAQELGREWIGIDITHYAVTVIEKRLRKAFSGVDILVDGRPRDFESAKELAKRDKFQFQWWANWLVGVQNYREKFKGPDRGIDGIIFFKNGPLGTGRVIVSIKGGEHIGPDMVRALAGTVEREGAELGLFVTLANPSANMRREAAGVGLTRTAHGKFPKVQIATIEDLLNGIKPNLPPAYQDTDFDEELGRQARRTKNSPQLEFTFKIKGSKERTIPSEHLLARSLTGSG